MKAEEHPLSQAQAEEMFNFLLGSGSFENLFFGDDHIGQTGKWWWRSKCVRPLQKRFLELLKAEQELEKKKEDHFNSLVYISNQGLKISELEETISRLTQRLKLSEEAYTELRDTHYKRNFMSGE